MQRTSPAFLLKTFLFAGLAITALAATPAPAQQQPQEQPPARPPSDTQQTALATEVARQMANELGRMCPVRPADDQAALESCRAAMLDGSVVRTHLPGIVLWGRQRRPDMTLKESSLTQFAPEAFLGMYAPLFMFNGKVRVDYDQHEQLYLMRFPVAFRNRLAPGQFPYPFWHEENKWLTYENANEFMLWWDPAAQRIKAAQFRANSDEPKLVENTSVKHAFDGKWLWTDAQGQTQPAVTLFDGMFSTNNPHLSDLDKAYKDFALTVREGQCMDCHVPNNPNKMKRLVLLQTPAHAAAEIKRVNNSVRKNTMPVDDFKIEKPLDEKVRDAFLAVSERFERLVDAARQWENTNAVARNEPTKRVNR